MATDREDIALDRLFQAGRAGPVPSDDFMARILADAAREAAPVPVPATPTARPGLLASLLSAIGGWPAAAGMATAAMAGVWLGFSSPELIDTYVGTDGTVALGDFLPDVTALAGEGS
jgi:hypothetical protein